MEFGLISFHQTVKCTGCHEIVNLEVSLKQRQLKNTLVGATAIGTAKGLKQYPKITKFGKLHQRQSTINFKVALDVV